MSEPSLYCCSNTRQGPQNAETLLLVLGFAFWQMPRLGGSALVKTSLLPDTKSRWFYIITRGLLSYTPKNFVILGLQNFGCKFNKIHQELVRQRPPPRIKMHLPLAWVPMHFNSWRRPLTHRLLMDFIELTYQIFKGWNLKVFGGIAEKPRSHYIDPTAMCVW